MGGQNRQNGTAAPKKAPKKKEHEYDETDLENQAKAKKAADEKKAMLASLQGKKGPLNTGKQGIKKSGK